MANIFEALAPATPKPNAHIPRVWKDDKPRGERRPDDPSIPMPASTPWTTRRTAAPTPSAAAPAVKAPDASPGETKQIIDMLQQIGSVLGDVQNKQNELSVRVSKIEDSQPQGDAPAETAPQTGKGGGRGGNKGASGAGAG